jgi:hypothetical protein
MVAYRPGMRRGICGKCGSSTVRAAENGVVMGESPGRTFLRAPLEPGDRGWVPHTEAKVWAFACTTCGYLELHVLDPVGIGYIAERWAPVPVQAPQPPPHTPS